MNGKHASENNVSFGCHQTLERGEMLFVSNDNNVNEGINEDGISDGHDRGDVVYVDGDDAGSGDGAAAGGYVDSGGASDGAGNSDGDSDGDGGCVNGDGAGAGNGDVDSDGDGDGGGY